MGAEIIEKHFTLSNNFSSFRDHKISLNPKSFKKFVNEIYNLKKILGNYDKEINETEKSNNDLMRRKLILNKSLKSGAKIREKDLLILRSSEIGIFASEKKRVVGKRISKSFEKFENLLSNHLIK